MSKAAYFKVECLRDCFNDVSTHCIFSGDANVPNMTTWFLNNIDPLGLAFETHYRIKSGTASVA